MFGLSSCPPRQPTAGAAPKGEVSRRWDWVLKRTGEGIVLGAFLGLIDDELKLSTLRTGVEHWPLFAFLGALICLTRARPLLWALAGGGLLVVVIVGYTPLMNPLMRCLERSNGGSAPAVVVLGASIYEDGTLSAASQDRILHGYELLERGEAHTLVLTRTVDPRQSWIQEVRSQMHALGMDFPILVVGPVANTHDEALTVSALVRQQGWSRVILVTHAWHMRRAAAVFEKAGVRVICSPCDESSYDLRNLEHPVDRLRAFGDWLHEVIGYQWYSWRGWI